MKNRPSTAKEEDHKNKEFLQRYVNQKYASRRYSAAQMLGLPGILS